MSSTQRILVMAHAHPDFSLGGGEIAAYNLFKAYRANPAVEDAWYLGRADRGRGASGHITMRRANEYLWEQAVGNWHMMKAAHQESVVTWFADLIRALKPTVVHTHHYAHLGLEYLRVIKQVDPSIRIVMTLHEYMAICRQNGQMVKSNSKRLCSRESFDECHQCFPDSSAEDFWMRKRFFQSHFDLVDQFVSPSEFLRQRYIAWGIAPERIVVIENGQSPEEPLPPRPLADGEARNRFGFFGQINPFKGIDVLLEALNDLGKADRKRLVLEVHGANLEWQTDEFKARIQNLSEPLIKSGCLRWVGPYQPHELRARMAAVDWVVVPSIWWENSPMVIQEAFVLGRPLMVSNIGGMAEKVRDGVDGIHVAAGNHLDWASKFMALAAGRETWERLREGIQTPLTYQACASAHLPLMSAT
jgi:glycosyltransferase involved in cell wall biosynthesis